MFNVHLPDKKYGVVKPLDHQLQMCFLSIQQYLMIYSGLGMGNNSQGQLLPAQNNQGFQYNSSFNSQVLVVS